MPEKVSRTYIVACRGPNCRERGSRLLRSRLSALLRGNPSACLVGYACFGLCDLGPNVALYPQGVWFGGLSHPDDAQGIVTHLAGGAPPAAPLLVPEPARSQHLANLAEVIRTVEKDAGLGGAARGGWWRLFPLTGRLRGAVRPR